MIKQTQEQGRESLEELAKQAIESPEKARAEIPIEQHKKRTIEEYNYNFGIKVHMDFHSRFYNLIRSIASPEYRGILSPKQRETFLKLLRAKKLAGVDRNKRALFADQKLRYYRDLADNSGLTNVAQIVQTNDLWSFGKCGLKLEDSYSSYFGDLGYHYLKKGDYRPIVMKLKRKLPELWTRLKKDIERSLERTSQEYPTLYDTQKSQWDLTNYRNAFRVFTGYANSLVVARKLKENECNILSSIQEEAKKQNECNKNRY